ALCGPAAAAQAGRAGGAARRHAPPRETVGAPGLERDERGLVPLLAEGRGGPGPGQAPAVRAVACAPRPAGASVAACRPVTGNARCSAPHSACGLDADRTPGRRPI